MVHHACDLVLLRQWEQGSTPKAPHPTLHPPQPPMGSESGERLPKTPRLLGVWDRQRVSTGLDYNREINYFLVITCASVLVVLVSAHLNTGRTPLSG